MHNFTATDEAVIEAFKFRLDEVVKTNDAQHMILKKELDDAGMSFNFMIPLKVPPHFLSRDSNHNTLGDIYLARDEAINEISELAFNVLSFVAIEEMLQTMEKTTGSELLFIRPHTSLTSLFISTPQVLILLVIENKTQEESHENKN